MSDAKTVVAPAVGQRWADLNPNFGFGRELIIIRDGFTSKRGVGRRPQAAFECEALMHGKPTGRRSVIAASGFAPALKRYALVGAVDWDALDDGMRDLVKWLWNRGFVTTDSGIGTKAATQACSLPYPNVFIAVAPAQLVAETDRLALELANVGVRVVPQMDVTQPSVNGAYNSASGHAVIMLIGVTSSMLVHNTAVLPNRGQL